LNIKKPILLPLELQVQLKKEKEQLEAAAAEARLKELEELENKLMQLEGNNPLQERKPTHL